MAMNQARVGLLVAAALVAMPMAALAQPKGQPASAQAGKQPADAAAGGEKEINLDEEQPVDENQAGQGPNGEPDGSEGLGDICKIDPTACPTIDMNKAAARDLNQQMYAVQQIYALRRNRFEINPYFGVTMNDQF